MARLCLAVVLLGTAVASTPVLAAPAARKTAAAQGAEAAATRPVQAEPRFLPPTQGIEGKRWGGTVSLGIPHPVWLELEYLENLNLTAGVGLGGIAIPLKSPSGTRVDLGVMAIDARARWHPLQNSFFLGAAIGIQSLYGKAMAPIRVPIPNDPLTLNTTVKATISSLYLTPHFGWFWVFETGFCVGFDFGLQMPFGAKTQIDISTDNDVANYVIEELKRTPEYQDLEGDVQDAGNKVGRARLPYFTLLRLGWMF